MLASSPGHSWTLKNWEWPGDKANIMLCYNQNGHCCFTTTGVSKSLNSGCFAVAHSEIGKVYALSLNVLSEVVANSYLL